MWQYLHNLWKRIKRPKPNLVAFPEIFEHFQELLQDHQQVMELIADLGEKSGGEYIFDRKYLADTIDEMHNLIAAYGQGTESHHLQPLSGALPHSGPDFYSPGVGAAGAAEPVPGDAATWSPCQRRPLDRPELTGGKANNLAVIMQNLCPAGAARFRHHHPGLSPLPGAQPAGGAHSRLAGVLGGGRERRRARPPGRSSTASWPGWCPRKWPREIRRQAEKTEAYLGRPQQRLR